MPAAPCAALPARMGASADTLPGGVAPALPGRLVRRDSGVVREGEGRSAASSSPSDPLTCARFGKWVNPRHIRRLTTTGRLHAAMSASQHHHIADACVFAVGESGKL